MHGLVSRVCGHAGESVMELAARLGHRVRVQDGAEQGVRESQNPALFLVHDPLANRGVEGGLC